jgi:hypothetical protein
MFIGVRPFQVLRESVRFADTLNAAMQKGFFLVGKELAACNACKGAVVNEYG